MNIIDELSWRGAVNQMTDEEGLRKLTEEKSISLYCGVDPTGDSMHIGHLIPFMMLKRFANAGHHPYVVIGGGTGAIGDPSGRKTERQLQTLDKIKANAEKLKAQFMHLFGDSENITFVRPIIFGIDGLDDALAAIKNGEMQGTVYNDKEDQALEISRLVVDIYQGNSMKNHNLQQGKYYVSQYKKVEKSSIDKFIK